MELKRHLSGKYIFASLYFLAFAIYIIIGLQPAEAVQYDISGELSIPAINLTSDVTQLTLNDHKLDTPNTIVGSYSESPNKTLLIGHSTTVFQNLREINLGDMIYYNGNNYEVVSSDTLVKSEIDMTEILSKSDLDTIVIMTCAGQLLDGGDATHRLIVTAVASD